jgi:hypothetical protein
VILKRPPAEARSRRVRADNPVGRKSESTSEREALMSRPEASERPGGSPVILAAAVINYNSAPDGA